VEETDERNDVRGILWALLGSLGYAAYLVLLRRRVKDESKLDIAMFFGARSNISTPYTILHLFQALSVYFRPFSSGRYFIFSTRLVLNRLHRCQHAINYSMYSLTA
jgi:drug/metabolite transporter (DMT)-like permease